MNSANQPAASFLLSSANVVLQVGKLVLDSSQIHVGDVHET